MVSFGDEGSKLLIPLPQTLVGRLVTGPYLSGIGNGKEYCPDTVDFETISIRSECTLSLVLSIT